MPSKDHDPLRSHPSGDDGYARRPGGRAVFASAGGILYVVNSSKVTSIQVTNADKPGLLEDCTAVANDMLGRL